MESPIKVLVRLLDYLPMAVCVLSAIHTGKLISYSVAHPGNVVEV